MIPTKFIKVNPTANIKNITAKNIQASIDKIANDLATEFLENEIIPVLNKRYGKEDTEQLLQCVEIKNGTLKITDNNTPFEKVWHVIEYGMKDKGIKANPIIRFKWEEYKEKLIQNIDKLIAGKE
jgi:hypothetical protein